MSCRPEWSNVFNSYRIEAAWKLGDWHCLEHSLKEVRENDSYLSCKLIEF